MRRQETGWAQGTGWGIGPQLSWKWGSVDGCRAQPWACGFGTRRGVRLAQLASIFSWNDESRSAKGVGGCGKGLRSRENSWANAWEGIKCVANVEGMWSLSVHPTEPLGKGSPHRLAAISILRNQCPSGSQDPAGGIGQALSEGRTWALFLLGAAGRSLGPGPEKLRVGPTHENQITASFHSRVPKQRNSKEQFQ